jgi:hypothetical protein
MLQAKVIVYRNKLLLIDLLIISFMRIIRMVDEFNSMRSINTITKNYKLKKNNPKIQYKKKRCSIDLFSKDAVSYHLPRKLHFPVNVTK